MPGGDERRLHDDHVVELEPFRLPRDEERDAVEGAPLGERGLDELDSQDDEREEPLLGREAGRDAIRLPQERVLLDTWRTTGASRPVR